MYTPELNELHNSNGWYFKRLEDGSIRIRHVRPVAGNDQIVVDKVIPPNEWASIVAYLTSRGETHETFLLAERLMDGKLKLVSAD